MLLASLSPSLFDFKARPTILPSVLCINVETQVKPNVAHLECKRLAEYQSVYMGSDVVHPGTLLLT